MSHTILLTLPRTTKMEILKKTLSLCRNPLICATKLFYGLLLPITTVFFLSYSMSGTAPKKRTIMELSHFLSCNLQVPSHVHLETGSSLS